MASVSFRQVFKEFPGGVQAVNDFTLDIKDKEFLALVGPSGSGKSTVLRMLAGLEKTTRGDILIGGESVIKKPPKDRGIAMVFQGYALFNHLTVFDNIALGLKIGAVAKTDIKDAVENAAEMLGLSNFLDRKPQALSGGQQQRVALGRALVMKPEVFLLDEPLSNLDAKLRSEMRAEIIRLHERVKATFIYVTHDQVEAMTMGNRIVVMQDGYIRQSATPSILYNNPADKFVAGFIGSPQMNFLDGFLTRAAGETNYTADTKTCSESVCTNSNKDLTGGTSRNAGKKGIIYLEVLGKRIPLDIDLNFEGNLPVSVGIRPESIVVHPANEAHISLNARVGLIEELGAESIIYAEIEVDDDNNCGNRDDCARTTNIHDNSNGSDVIEENRVAIKFRTTPSHKFKRGDSITIALMTSAIKLFDVKNGRSIPL